MDLSLFKAMLGASEKKFVAAEHASHRDMLEEIRKRESDYRDMLARSSAALALKVEVGDNIA